MGEKKEKYDFIFVSSVKRKDTKVKRRGRVMAGMI